MILEMIAPVVCRNSAYSQGDIIVDCVVDCSVIVVPVIEQPSQTSLTTSLPGFVLIVINNRLILFVRSARLPFSLKNLKNTLHCALPFFLPSRAAPLPIQGKILLHQKASTFFPFVSFIVVNI